MLNEAMISVISIIVTLLSIILSIVSDARWIGNKLIKLDITIVATIISYSLYLILLYLVLKGINKVPKSNQEERENNNIKILKIFVVGSCLFVSLFKFLLIYNTSNLKAIEKMLFLVLFVLISYIVNYCLCVSDIYEISHFSSLFFVNRTNKKNIFYKLYTIAYNFIIIFMLLIITYFIAICLGIDLNQMICEWFCS